MLRTVKPLGVLILFYFCSSFVLLSKDVGLLCSSDEYLPGFANNISRSSDTIDFSTQLVFTSSLVNKWQRASSSDDELLNAIDASSQGLEFLVAYCNEKTVGEPITLVGSDELLPDVVYLLNIRYSFNIDNSLSFLEMTLQENDTSFVRSTVEPRLGSDTSLFDNIDTFVFRSTVSNLSSSVKYSGGNGSVSDPYQISTVDDLIALSNKPNHWKRHFIQTSNIIFDSTSSLVDWNGDGTIDNLDVLGFSPLGNEAKPFTGSYNGQGFRIKYLYSSNNNDNVGMFGFIEGAELSNIGLAKVYIDALSCVGGLVGYCNANNIIQDCYSTGYVAGSSYVGGLIGYINSSTLVNSSLSTCDVSGIYVVGGFIGTADGSDVTISNSCSSGSVSSIFLCGGFMGTNTSSEVVNVYSATEVDGMFLTGGLIGINSSTDITNSYWDVEVSGLSTSSGGDDVQGLSSDEIKDSTNLVDWDFSDSWSIDPEYNDGYPYIADQVEFYEPVETEFTGDGKWSDPSNWSNGVPDLDEITTAIISGECDLTDPIEVENLIISIGGSLSLGGDSDIDVVNAIVIESDKTGVGELLSDNELTVDTVCQEKYFAAGTWTFMCSPIDITAGDLFMDLNLATSWSDPLGEYWILAYSQDQRASVGAGMIDVFDASYVLDAGTGYMVWVDEPTVGIFKHVAPHVESTVNVDYTSGYAMNNTGWNLVGNPFTYSMSYDDVFDCSHNSKCFTGAVYVWDGNSYKTWVSGIGDIEASDLEPLEAFFVQQVSDEDSYFCMTKGDCDCISSPTVASKSLEIVEKDILSIELSSHATSDKTYIVVDNSSTDKFDIGSDAFKIDKSASNVSVVYSLDASDEAYAISCFPMTDEVKEIPLVLNLLDGTSQFSLSFFNDSSLFNYSLLDVRDSVYYDIADSLTLSFFVDEDLLIEGRFVIVITPPDNSINFPTDEQDQNLNVLNFSCVSFDKLLQLNSASLTDISLSVFNMAGHSVFDGVLEASSSIDIDVVSGVYIIRGSVGNQTVVDRVIVY